MSKLSRSIIKEARYGTGGVALALALSTFNEKGQNFLAIEREDDPDNPKKKRIKGITLREGATIHRLDFEDGSCSYTDGTQFGNNIYPKHAVNYKFAGKTAQLDAFAETVDLSKTTHLLRTKLGTVVILGAENGLQAEKDESGSGAAAGDFNGYDITVAGAEARKAEIVPEAVWLALLGQVDGAAAAAPAPEAGA